MSMRVGRTPDPPPTLGQRLDALKLPTPPPVPSSMERAMELAGDTIGCAVIVAADAVYHRDRGRLGTLRELAAKQGVDCEPDVGRHARRAWRWLAGAIEHAETTMGERHNGHDVAEANGVEIIGFEAPANRRTL